MIARREREQDCVKCRDQQWLNDASDFVPPALCAKRPGECYRNDVGRHANEEPRIIQYRARRSVWKIRLKIIGIARRVLKS